MKRSTLILLFIAVALGGLVFFIVRQDKQRGTGRDSEETSKPAFKFKREDVSTITLTRAGQTVRLEHQSGKWRITEPLTTDAEEAAVDTLVSDLANANIERTLVMTESLRRGSGLSNPTVTVEVKLKNGEQHKIVLGKEAPTGFAAYAQIDGGADVALVGQSLLTSANKSFNELRDKSLLKVNLDDLMRVEIKNPHLKLVAEKDKDGKWLIVEPADKKGKEAKTDKLFAFQYARATEVIDTPPADLTAKLASPAVTVRLTDKNSQGTTLEISAADGDNIYARVSGRVTLYKANKQLLEDLSFKPADVSP